MRRFSWVVDHNNLNYLPKAMYIFQFEGFMYEVSSLTVVFSATASITSILNVNVIKSNLEASLGFILLLNLLPIHPHGCKAVWDY